MTRHFQKYSWKQGIPYGSNPIEVNKITKGQLTYKIVMDPYKKRISIEKYSQLKFEQLIYDSSLLDFRKLTPSEQTAWQKTVVQETPSSILSLIRNQDDRIVYFEECFFEKELCRECRITSPHGILLSIHRMSYESLNDPFNGVTLFDANERPVISKKYAVNSITGEFTDLLNEDWNMNK